MEFFIYASAIFNLSCALHANSYYQYELSQYYSELLSVKNVWPLLCADSGVWCAPAPTATPGHYGQRAWGFPPGFPRPKIRRKRGRRRKTHKVRVITSAADRPPER